MDSPYLAKSFSISYDELYDLKAGSFYTHALSCPFQCMVCPPLATVPAQTLDMDTFLQELQRYKLMGVELFLIRGYEPTLQVPAHMPYLELLAPVAPIRIHTNGQKPQPLLKLLEVAEGVCLDIKAAPLDHYSLFDRDFYPRFIPALVHSSLEKYRRNLRESMDYVDPHQFTYYTSSTFPWLPEGHKTTILELITQRYKKPFIPYGPSSILPRRV